MNKVNISYIPTIIGNAVN